MPMGRTASRLARVVAGKSEPSLQRGLSTQSRNVLMATRAGGLAVRHGANRLPVVKLPQRTLVAASRPVKGAGL